MQTGIVGGDVVAAESAFSPSGPDEIGTRSNVGVVQGPGYGDAIATSGPFWLRQASQIGSR